MGNDASARFWTDSWLSNGAIYNFASILFQAVGCRRIKRTVKEALTNHQWARDITGAPTVVVLCEYVHVWDMVEPFQMSPHSVDRYI